MKYKILVVDDDKELVKMLCSYFNMKQYETITATDGMEALNKIKMKPDIILLDINMPRMDGIEVCHGKWMVLRLCLRIVTVFCRRQ